MSDSSPDKNKKSSSRILTIDIMRGYFMVAIILNHLQWYPSGLDWVAMRGALLVSAAEGFFLLSGIVLGMVRGRKLLDKPFRVSATLLLKRGLLLYVTTVVLTFLFMVIGWLFFMDNPGLKPGIRPIDQPIGEVIMGILSFKYLYGWADFLRLYSIFIIASPLMLWLIRKNKWYIAAAISVGLWALFPWVHEHGDNSAEILMVLSWQLIFFAGMTIGFYWKQIMDGWQNLSNKVRKPIYATILFTAGATLLANIVIVSMDNLGIPSDAISSWYRSILPLFFKEELPLARLVLFGLWFMLGYFIIKKFESPIAKYFGWLLIPFGQNSLYVYILHAVLVFFAHTLLLPPDPNIPWPITGALSIVIIGIIHLAVRKRFLFKIIPR